MDVEKCINTSLMEKTRNVSATWESNQQVSLKKGTYKNMQLAKKKMYYTAKFLGHIFKFSSYIEFDTRLTYN